MVSPDGTPAMTSSFYNYRKGSEFTKTCDRIKETNLKYKHIDYKRVK